MGILNPLFSWFLLLTLPIIALYLLRPRSQQKIAPSTFLWKKTIESIDTERLDKRLIKNWLFYLQLAIVIMGALLLMQPYFQRAGIESKDIVVVIDSSASMSTKTEEISRLEDVKKTAEDLISSLKGTPSVTVYDINTDLIQVYKGHSKRTALEKIGGIVESQKPLKTSALEVMIDSYTLSDDMPEIFIFSDHQFLEDARVRYSLSSRGENLVAINKVMSRKSSSGDHLQIILENLSGMIQNSDLVIYGEDTLLSIEAITLSAKEKKSIQFTSAEPYKNYTVLWQGEDAYELDNSYYLPMEVASVKKILLQGDSNKFLEQALIILPRVEVYKSDELSIDSGYDLYVYNGVLPETLPKLGSLLIIDPDKTTSYLSVGLEKKEGELYFDTSDQIWRYVNLNFGIRTVKTISTVIGKNILSIDDAPVILKGKLEEHPAVIIGFDLLESDFPIRTGFPVFMHNTASYLLGNLSHEIREGVIGSPLLLLGDPRANNRVVVGTNGEKNIVEEDYELSLTGETAGFYLLQEFDDQTLVKERWIGLNVSRGESIIVSNYSEGSTTIISRSALSYHSLKWLVAVLFILLLFIEWWVYYRGY